MDNLLVTVPARVKTRKCTSILIFRLKSWIFEPISRWAADVFRSCQTLFFGFYNFFNPFEQSGYFYLIFILTRSNENLWFFLSHKEDNRLILRWVNFQLFVEINPFPSLRLFLCHIFFLKINFFWTKKEPRKQKKKLWCLLLRHDDADGLTRNRLKWKIRAEERLTLLALIFAGIDVVDFRKKSSFRKKLQKN